MAMPPETSNINPRILCFGVATVDYAAVVEHIPKPDEKMRSSSLRIAGGGNAANTACAMGLLSKHYQTPLKLQVDLATAVGKDINGNTILEEIAQHHVDIHDDNVERYEGNSPFSYIMTTPDHARTIIHQPASREMSVAFANEMKLQQYKAVHLDGRHPQAAIVVADKCFDHNIPYSLDVERPREGLDHLLAKATIVICNSSYCKTVTINNDDELPTSAKSSDDDDDSRKDLKMVAHRLKQVIQQQAPNAKIAIQTMGSKGSILIRMNTTHEITTSDSEKIILESDETGHVPVVKEFSYDHIGDVLWCAAWGGSQVVDSTGAGDAFQGGFLTALWSYLASSRALSEKRSTILDGVDQIPSKILAHAMRIGTRIAAKKIEAPGAREGLPRNSDDDPLQEDFRLLGDMMTN